MIACDAQRASPTSTIRQTLPRAFSKHVLHVVGARPNFMKAGPVMEALARRDGIGQTLVHTGQHYEAKMSDVFFRELGMSEPEVNLKVGSGSHARQTAEIMSRLEAIVLQRKPDLVLVYGDVNSTVAAALLMLKAAGARRSRRSRPTLVRSHDAGGNQPPAHRSARWPSFHSVVGGR